MRRADHFRAADERIWRARRNMSKADLTEFETLLLELLAGIGHATLAAAGPGVEQEVTDIEKREAQALGAAESPPVDQRARQAARPPLPPHSAAAAAAVGALDDRPKPRPPSDCTCGAAPGRPGRILPHPRGSLGCRWAK